MITITKKESLFLSVYHTVWMLHKAKTARLVITLYRHITDKLPTSYRHITNCRPTVGRLSADCRPTDSLCFGENLSAVYRRPTDSQQTADSRPTDGRQSANRRPTVGQQTADSRPTDGRQSADSWPTGFLGSSSSQLPTKPDNSAYSGKKYKEYLHHFRFHKTKRVKNVVNKNYNKQKRAIFY